VRQLKLAIWARERIPPEEQCLNLCGKQLEDDRILADYNMQHGSTIQLSTRLLGGMNSPNDTTVEITEKLTIATWNIGGAEMIKIEQVLYAMEQ
jgi:hypothetical protein